MVGLPKRQSIASPPPDVNVEEPDAVNVDPGEPFMAGSAVGGGGPHQGAEDHNGGRFVGGFVQSVRNIVQQARMPKDTRESAAEPYGYPLPPDPYPDRDIEAGRSRMSASTPTSETARASQDIFEPEADSTAVDHGLPYSRPTGYGTGSPQAILVEPQPASDYAKMDSISSHSTIKSFGSYIARIPKLLRQLNDLPWVADRVTVDYYPGRKKRHSTGVSTPPLTTLRSVPPSQAPSPWYGGGGLELEREIKTPAPSLRPFPPPLPTHPIAPDPSTSYSHQHESILMRSVAPVQSIGSAGSYSSQSPTTASPPWPVHDARYARPGYVPGPYAPNAYAGPRSSTSSSNDGYGGGSGAAVYAAPSTPGASHHYPYPVFQQPRAA